MDVGKSAYSIKIDINFVMQPLLLPILRAVNLHVLILKIVQYVGFSQILSQFRVAESESE